MTDREKLIDIRNQIDEHLSEKNLIIKNAVLDGDRIFIEWESSSIGKFDFEWYNPGLGQKEWEHSRTRWTPNDLPRLEDGTHSIGLYDRRDKSHDDKWKLRAVSVDGTLLAGPKDVVKKDEGEPETPDPEPEPDWKPSFDVIVGDVRGCYNVHGIKDDESMHTPPLTPDRWEILNNNRPIVHFSETVGERKIDPVGFYLSGSGLNVFYNNGWANYERWFELRDKRGYNGASNQAGSLYSFNDDFSQKKEHPENPVLDQPQRTWQGRNRVNPYALVYHEIEKQFYCFYGDFAEGGDCDKYSGRRALGCAVSKDLVKWEYITTEEPLLDVQKLYSIYPEAFPNTRFCQNGRLYAYGATWQNDQIYLSVGGSIDGDNLRAIIRSRDVMSYWKPVSTENIRPMPIRVKGKWYYPQNTSSPSKPGFRAIAIVVSDTLEKGGESHHVFETDQTRSSGVSRQLFAYKGKWHIAYRQSDDDDNRSMYIAREV